MELVTVDQYEAEGERKDKELEPIEAFAERTYKQLGYTGVRSQLERQRQTKVGGNLLAVLREHGVPFYRPEDVDAYKAKMVRKAEAYPKRALWPILGGLVTLAGALVLWLIQDGFTALSWTALGVGSAALGGGSIWALNMPERVNARWYRHSLEHSYTKEVPTPALELALGLKEKAPGVSFMVEELEVTRIERVWPDPLLYVTLDGEKLCIAKWDEPKFTAPLTY
jgi:hypothetical protein